MFKQNDFFFDNRVRFVAESHTDPSLIPEWNKLEVKLDIEMPVKKKRRRFIVFWLLVVGMLAGAAYWGFDGNFISKNTYTNKGSSEVKKNTNIAAESGKNENLIIQDNKNVKVYIDNLPKDPESKNRILPSLTQTHTTYTNSSSEKKTRKNRIFLTAPLKEQVSMDDGKNKSVIKEISDKKLLTPDMATQNNINSDNGRTNIPKKTTLLNTKFLNDESVGTAAKDTSSSITNNNAKPNIKKPSVSRFLFTVVGGVNVNSVQLNKPSKPGYDYGILVGYKISPKVEIKSGVILAKKHFSTSGNNISFDSAKLNFPSYNTISLENATGYCRFIEVPAMLYYQFSAKKKTTFYAAGGFSIIKMRMDNINYRFLADGNTILERSHTNAYHNSNSFSTSITANFSLGVKRMITDRWTFAIEPYIKLPQSRMNDSNLKFTAFGTLASFTYSLPARQNN